MTGNTVLEARRDFAREPLRVLIADDNPVIRMGLTSLLEESGRVDVVGEAGNGAEALEQARRLTPDVVLLDVRMPLHDGLSVLPELVALCRVLMLTHNEEHKVIDAAIRGGAIGYLVHGEFSADELVRAVLGAGDGRSYLSPVAVSALMASVREPAGGTPAVVPPPRPVAGAVTEPIFARTVPAVAVANGLSEREIEVMDHIARGLSNADIAAALFLSEKTVKNHVNRIYAKLHVRNRGEAIATWFGTSGTVRAPVRGAQ